MSDTIEIVDQSANQIVVIEGDPSTVVVQESNGTNIVEVEVNAKTLIIQDAGVQGPVGVGVPMGGTAGQALTKIDGINYNTQWTTIDKAFVGLGNVDNTSDINKPVSTATQTALNGKENLLGFTPENVANKSTNTSLGTSDTLYPTQNAVKNYVDNAVISGSTPDATSTIKGKLKLAGDLSGTADLPTVPALANKANTSTTISTTTPLSGGGDLSANRTLTISQASGSSDGYLSSTDWNTFNGKQNALGYTPESVANKSTTTTLGTSDVLYPSQNAVKTYVDNAIVAGATPDATTTLKGKVRLAGDLSGTADLPTVPGLANKEDLANKSNNTSLGTSATLYPTQNAVKAYVDAQVGAIDSNIDQYRELQKEPTGFPNRTDSTMSINVGTRTFTIQPTTTSYDVYVKGVKFTKTTSQSSTWPNLPGSHYFYFDISGNLQTTQVFNAAIITDNAFIAIVYWNTDNSTVPYYAEERHGLVMDGETHSYLHTVLGARYISGGALQNFDVNGTGNLASNAQFTSDSGSIRDEDILHQYLAQTQIPILYRIGTLWRKKAADAYPVIYSGTAGYTGANGRLPYNQLVAGNWQLTQVGNNQFVLVHIFATNDINNPVVGIQGTVTYNDVNSARTGALTEITTLAGLPFAEFVALGSVVFETANTYSNVPKARIRSVNGGNYVDFRGTQPYAPSASVASSHSLLSNLSSDDHLQYLTDARGDVRYYQKFETYTKQETDIIAITRAIIFG